MIEVRDDRPFLCGANSLSNLHFLRSQSAAWTGLAVAEWRNWQSFPILFIDPRNTGETWLGLRLVTVSQPSAGQSRSVMTSSDVMTTIYNHQSVICLLGKIMIILNTQITTIMLQMSYKHGIVMSSCTNWPNNLTIIIIKHSKIIFPSHKVSTICT